MGAGRSRRVLIRQACIAGLSAAILSGIVVALAWGLLSGEAFESRRYEQSEEALDQARLRAAAAHWGRQIGSLNGREAAAAELDGLLRNGSYNEGETLGYGYSWNQTIALGLEKSSRQSYEGEPGTQWIELRR
ncbi:MAG: hypothetical protein OXI41_15105 [Chloroflexota bacterium]|nr:hypothetical protein [Chloroflexota bacterium]MDE2894255.1 hypothetical protein [Chloroflexota bacterium]